MHWNLFIDFHKILANSIEGPNQHKFFSSYFQFKFIFSNYFKIISTQLKTCKPFDQRRSEKIFQTKPDWLGCSSNFQQYKERRETWGVRSEEWHKIGKLRTSNIVRGYFSNIEHLTHILETMDRYNEALPLLFPF